MANGYKKISGGGRTGHFAITRVSLWQGPDHLLQVENDGYGEGYRRVYFKDIESFTIRRDNRQRNYMIFLTIMLALVIWISIVGMGVWGSIPIAFFATLLLVNIAKGPSCVTHVTTAVQRLQLPSLRRVKNAERALYEVFNGAQSTQGLLSGEEARMRFQLRAAPPIPTQPYVATPPAGLPEAELPPPV
jgi:hypothetical protein